VELEMSGEKDLELNLRSSRRKEFSDMSGHSTSSRTPSVLKKEKKKCFEKPENQKEKTEEIEKKQKGPKTGPLPASSMPMMQGLDAHSGRGGSDLGRHAASPSQKRSFRLPATKAAYVLGIGFVFLAFGRSGGASL
jgi:hypothetical protein